MPAALLLACFGGEGTEGGCMRVSKNDSIAQEAYRGTACEELGIVLARIVMVGGDKDHAPDVEADLPCDVEPALRAERDVDQGHVRAQLARLAQRPGPVACDTNHGHALLLEFGPSYLEEWLVVIDDEPPERHGSSVAARPRRPHHR